MEFTKKINDEPQKVWNRVLWLDETKINVHQSEGKAKVWRTKRSAPKQWSSMIEAVSWLGLAWLLLEWAH